MNKPTIENWTLISLRGNQDYQINGKCKGDPRAADGTAIRTSTLKSINFETGEAQTLNTSYLLGAPADGTTMLGLDIETIKKEES